MRKLLFAILAILPSLAVAQIGNYPVLIGQRGTTLPATCTIGQLFYKTNAAAGSNIYGCTAANTWTAQAGGGGGTPGGSDTQVQYNNAGAFGGITGATTNGTTLTLTAPILGTPASVTLTNATGLPLTTGVTGTLGVGNGGTGITSGTSGGVPYYSASNTIASSGALTANVPVIGGGAGVAPSSGSRSGNTTTFATTSGALTSGNCAKFDASGNIVDNGSACGGGGATALSAITAASAGNTIGSGNNTGQVWNWANTTDSTTAFTIGETSAATGGTSTSGVPNQVLHKITTVAASTQAPLSVYSRGTHVFSVSPSAMQILAGSGSGSSAVGSASVPIYSFAGWETNGLYITGGQLSVASNGSNLFTGSSSQMRMNNGSVSAPTISNQNGTNSGIWWPSDSGVFSVAISGTENTRWTAGVQQVSKASADAVGFGLNSRKSRGTVASPTVITTGDDLLTVSGYGYVGGTNTYREAARITLDSVGTISDATNGIGGNIDFSTQKQGTDTSPAVRARIDQNGHILSIAGTANTPAVSSCGTSGSVTGTDNAMLVTVGTGGTATTCAVNFGTAYGTAPICMAQNDTDRVAYSIVTSTTAVTVTATAAFTAGSKFHLLCMGN